MAEASRGTQELQGDADVDPSSSEYKQTEKEGPRTTISIGSAQNVVHNGKITVIHKRSKPKKTKKESRHRKPQKPLTASSEKLSLDQRLQLRERLGRDWRDLGRYLGFDDGQLEQLEVQWSDTEERNYQLLLRWEREYDDQATRASLAQILAVKLKRGDLADLLADDV